MRCPAFSLFGLMAMALPAVSTAADPQHDPTRVGWARIELVATKLFVTARSEIDLSRPVDSDVDAELIDIVGDALVQPDVDGSGLIAIRTTFLGQESQLRFLFQPKNARALQRSELSISKKRQRLRTYRYAEQGVYVRTLAPKESESALPFEQWTHQEDKQTDFPPPGFPRVVTEAAALLYAIPASNLAQPGDTQTMHIFSRGIISPVDVAVVAKERISVDYVEVTAGDERKIKQSVEALRVSMRPRPPDGAGAGADRGSFKLLGLEGNIDLYLDPVTRAPLLLTGKIKIAGRVHLRACRVVLR